MKFKLLQIVSSVLVLTVVAVLILPVLRWAIFNAVFTGTSPDICIIPATGERIHGACWPVLNDTFKLLLAGRYPVSQLWRAVAVIFLPLPFFVGLWRRWFSGRGAFLWGLVLLLSMLALMHGAEFLGLSEVETNLWGGLALTCVLTTFGSAVALPLSVVLALARTSTLPVFHFLATSYIEFVRGVPLITLLFVGQFLFPLFLPAGTSSLDSLLRAQCVIVFFQAAILAEVIRGGLGVVGKGQKEACMALGLSTPRTLWSVVLPQAFRVSIPPLVGTFVGLFKDTSLVSIVGLFDLLGTARNIPTIPKWVGFDLEPLAAALVLYFAVSYAIARFGASFEFERSTQRVH